MSLAFMNQGESGIIKELNGNEEMKRHLQDIGFIKGERVEVLSENGSGMILMVKGIRVALNRALAIKITVGQH